MFGLSLAKLIVLAGIVLAVWYGFKFLNRIQAVREAEARRRATDGRGARRMAREDGREIEDMVKCRVCGAYVPARGTAACAQAGCPYGR